MKQFTPIPIPEAEPEKPKTVLSSDLSSGRLAGLGSFPADWPQLPGSVPLREELSWVQADRLLVVEETETGARIHHTRAMSPAPSMGAIAWLETSVRNYAKYLDVMSKALATHDDSSDEERAERMAIEEIRSLLAEMIDAEG